MRTVTATPPLQRLAYSDTGLAVGGVLNSLGAVERPGRSCKLAGLRVVEQGQQKAPLTLMLFNVEPAGSYPDGQSLSIDAMDLGHLCLTVTVPESAYKTADSV